MLHTQGRACARCGRDDADDDVTLHVHHRFYVSGRLPWSYELHQCEVLCAGCHAREHGLIRPTDGWIFVYYEDLGDLVGECEFCGTQLRHAYLVHHEGWEPIQVGTECCDQLTGSREATNRRREAERRDRFLRSTRWSSVAGALRIIKHGICFEVVLVGGDGYRVRMNGALGRKTHETAESAKGAIFDRIADGSAKRYVDLQRSRRRGK